MPATISSPANRWRRGIRTRFATGSRTRSSTCTWRPTRRRGWRARRWRRRTGWCWPARCAARAAIREIGYEQAGFHWQHAAVECHVHEQSPDIAQGVDAAGNKDEGAGDQGIMFGYAVRETPELMPAPIQFAHAILRSMAAARHAGAAPLLG